VLSEAETAQTQPEARAEAAVAERAATPAPRPRWRRALSLTITVLAGALVLFALVFPNRLDQFATPAAFLRIPVEGLLAAVLVLILPARAKRPLAVLLGAGLGLLTILKIFDMGFYESLDRPFDPVNDWPLLSDAVEYVRRSYGGAGATGAEIGALVLVLAVLTLMTLAVLRLTRLVGRHPTATVRGTAVAGVAWVTCALLGAQFVPGVDVASRNAAGLAIYRTLLTTEGLRDKIPFEREMNADAYRDTPGSQLLTGLRGKDVMVTFVESYGRVALQDPEFAPQIHALLDAGDQRLQAAGFAARSGWLTSPTSGGGSWLAHSTLLSGVWINNQRRYNTLLSSDRLNLDVAFQRAGWRTVGVITAIDGTWPQGVDYYKYDKLYTASDLGYRGPRFNFGSIPDQYTLSAFQRLERGPGHAPVMAETVLLSSHSPWAPLPREVGWDTIGDGSVAYQGMPAQGHAPSVERGKVRNDYIHAVEYSLTSVLNYVQTYGDKNLVMVFLGDHQPAPLVAGMNAVHNVPVTIVAKDPAVLDRVASWGWNDGLYPAANSPIWPMNTFRDRFLSTFGSTPGSH
jgi:hypothetical protein